MPIPTRQGRSLGAAVADPPGRGRNGEGSRAGVFVGRSGRGRSLGGLRGDELRGNTLIVGGFLVGGFLPDLLGGLVLLVGDDDGRDHVAGLVNGSLDDGHLVGRAAAEEEGSQLHGSLLGEDSADDLGRVRHAGVAQDVAQGSGGTGLGVPRSMREARIAPAHIVQGSRVTMSVQPVRRQVPLARPASRRATISA